MDSKILARKLIQSILNQLPRPFHRYLLSCYQQTPKAFLGTGYEVLLNLKETTAEDHSSSLHYFKNHAILQKLCSAASSATIFDVGANIGQTAVAYGCIFPSAVIHSFEPFRENFEHLTVNTKDYPNINTHRIALSDRNGSLEVKRDHHPLSQWNSISVAHQENLASRGNFQIERIETETGDGFCERQGVERIGLLKIDTEGHELEVLHGFQTMISRGRVYSILLEAGFSGDTVHGSFQAINQFMLDNGMVLGGVHDPDYHADGSTNFVNAFYFRSGD